MPAMKKSTSVSRKPAKTKAFSFNASSEQVATAGDLRRMTVNVLNGILNRSIESKDAAVVLKGVKEINNSLYSEIKHMALLVDLKRSAPELGKLPLFGSPEEK